MDKTPKSFKQNSLLALAALGVVFGDIGTSPLYALRECFSPHYGLATNQANILGVLSLIVWSLIILISVKYVGIVLRADNRGEGGILALMALALRKNRGLPTGWMVFVGVFGAALLVSDGMLTPAISVLSALEGIKIAAPGFSEFVIPVTIFILVLLFVFQFYGTAKIGTAFGPIILLWFSSLGALGIYGIFMNPTVLQAINPYHGFVFMVSNGSISFAILGAVFLVITGGEALYADMGHFGIKPIRKAWFFVALPGLVLNYFGQGALILMNPETIENPFYRLAPQWALIPLLGLATMASVIASQAVITGVFSLTSQAMQLGYCPRIKLVHTSTTEIGQIYVPFMNWVLMFGTLWLVLNFKTSSNLAAAYGIAVAMAMVTTTLLIGVVSRGYWKWPLWLAIGANIFFLLIDGSFLFANLLKIGSGGWFPIMMAVFFYIIMSTWRKGRQILMERMRLKTIPLEEFIKMIEFRPPIRVPGTAVFMFGDRKGTPPALYYNLKHNKVLHEYLVLLTILNEEVPFVSTAEKVQTEVLMPNLVRVTAHYGFMESPKIEDIMNLCSKSLSRPFKMSDITFYLGRENLIPSENKAGMSLWREKLFAFLSHNSQRASTYFQLPVDQTIEVGIQVEI